MRQGVFTKNADIKVLGFYWQNPVSSHNIRLRQIHTSANKSINPQYQNDLANRFSVSKNNTQTQVSDPKTISTTRHEQKKLKSSKIQ